MEDMRSLAMWTLAALVVLNSPSWCATNDGVETGADTTSVRSLLRSATVAQTAGDWTKAYASVVAALDDPQFPGLDSDTQHFAVSLATHAALQIARPDDAHRFAMRATQMPDSDIDDWRSRLTSAMKIGAVVDEAVCVREIARSSGAQGEFLSENTIFQVVRSTSIPEANDARTEMLLTLYHRGWRPPSGKSASGLWLELTRLLLLRNETELAVEVAALIDNPDDIIIMRSDFRFRAVLKSKYVDRDAHRAALKRLDSFKTAVKNRPRSLATLVRLLYAMVELRMDADVVALANNVGSRVSKADGGPSSYDDMTAEYPWIFNLQATALRHLGRYDEALDQLRRAAYWQGSNDKASHAINLGAFLCELGMPEEAIAALPANDAVNAYGKMQKQSVLLAAAVQLGRDADAGAALGYLREHGRDAPATYQHALLKAGDNEGAEHWLLTRLDDVYMRSQALLELQGFSESRYPPASAEWHARSTELKNRPNVRAAALNIGEIGRYAWRYDTFE